MLLQDARIRRGFFKVGIFHRISSISQGESHTIRAKLVDGVRERQKVARRLGHLFRIQEQMPVSSNTLRPPGKKSISLNLKFRFNNLKTCWVQRATLQRDCRGSKSNDLEPDLCQRRASLPGTRNGIPSSSNRVSHAG